MAITGNLSDFSLTDLMQVLKRGHKTGQLSVASPNGIHRIWIYQGRVVAAREPGRKMGLAEMLSEEELLSNRVLDKLTSRCDINEPLGVCLHRQGLITAQTLASLFRQQLRRAVYPLFALEEGGFEFDGIAMLPYGEMTGHSKGIMDVVIEGLRFIQNSSSSEINLLQPDQVLERTSLEIPLVKLAPLEWSVLEVLSTSPLRIHSVSQKLKEDLLEVRKICTRLHQVGLLQKSLLEVPGLIPVSVGLDYPLSRGSQRETSPVSTELGASPNLSLLSRLTSVLRGIR
ncbi:MAG: DUF4388 domain-containing protein [Thermostichus sp. DRC_bins_24]